LAKKLSQKTIRLLRKVAAHILEEPRRLKMGDWIETFNPEFKEDNIPPCGTQGCIAGWAAVLTDKNIKANDKGILQIPEDYYDDVENNAAEALGLTIDQANRLFYFKEWEVNYDDDAYAYVGWPTKFSKAYEKAKTAKTKAKITVQRIEHFITTNGAE
jgi:hypothetical protein